MIEDYGDVKDVRQDPWGASGFETAAESTTRLVRMTLRDGLTPDDLPHILKFYGGSVLVVVPGRAPQCLRCCQRGHIRRDCRTPRSFMCKAFGQLGQDCVPTYAKVIGRAGEPDVSPHIMDEEDAEAAAASTAAAIELHEAEVNGVSDTMDPPPENAEGGSGNATKEPETTSKTNGGDIPSTSAPAPDEDETAVKDQPDEEKDDETGSQHSENSTLTQKSDGFRTADETTNPPANNRKTALPKRRRETGPSDEQRLKQLEREWAKAASKKGKFLTRENRSLSASRTQRK
ncbi:hypothetical protein HPB48_017025 [Haemaphysalis longicornis]|uniref:CCHC-type domain-containing protein n=1 Tax=Haemaphysalis longicornis TaxID=44386 RepID=A0A9J6GYR6_HAELO|nr:hypothetical protein HPB48_017025 [Haemaphysalis longicornis]